jgi:peptidoglycan/LPS O-acetylase OafA/YrhL
VGTIRLLLALSVALVHLDRGIVMAPGRVAVEAFFVISGFYMAMVIDEKYGRQRRGAAVFWLSRYLRLAPVWVAVLSASIIAVSIFHLDIISAASHGTFVSAEATLPWGSWLYLVSVNAFMFLSDTTFLFFLDPVNGALSPSAHAMTMAEPAYRFLLIPQGWTIGTELSFYALAPFLVLQRVRTLVAIALGGLMLRAIGTAYGLTYEPFTYRFFPFELPLFVCGVLAYRLRDAMVPAALRRFGGMLTLLIAASIVLYERIDIVPTPVRHVIFLAMLVATLPAIFAASRLSRCDAAIGQLSYPLYLSHMLVLSLGLPTWTSLALVVGASILLTLLVEVPADRVRQRILARRREPSSHRPPWSVATPIPAEALAIPYTRRRQPAVVTTTTSLDQARER